MYLFNEIDTLIAKLRHKTFINLGRFIVGSLLNNPPNRIIRSITESLSNEIIKSHFIDEIIIAQPVVEYYKFTDNIPLYFRRDKSFDKRSVFLLKNLIVSPISGLIRVDNKFMLQESIGSLNRVLRTGEPSEAIRHFKDLEEDEYIFVCPDTGYYHFIFEVLPNLLHSYRFLHGEVKIITSHKASKYVTDTLKILFDNNIFEKMYVLSGSVRVKNLILTQFPAYSGFIHPFDLKTLVNFIKLNTNENKYKNYRKIYISRKKSRRPLKDEEIIEIMLEKIGFKIIYSEDFPLLEQFSLFANAEVIVAPHGAGLVNLVFSQQLKVVVEIFTEALAINDCYARLAVMFGAKYKMLFFKNNDVSNLSTALTELLKFY
ncbi:MAG: glycosyltransferase family 61 protein [Ignavibacteriaceae bacterium]|jgi:hypothetical protein